MAGLPQYEDTFAGVVVRPADAADPAIARSGRASNWLDERFERIVIVGELFADLLTVFFSVLIVYEARAYFHFPNGHTTSEVLSASLGFALLMVLLLDRENAYRQGNGLLRIRDTERVLRVAAQSFFVLFAITFVLPSICSRSAAPVICGTTLLMLLTEKHLVYEFVRWLHGKGLGVRNVLIYGAGQPGRRVFSALCRSPKLGLNPIIVIDDQAEPGVDRVFNLAYTRRKSAPVRSGPITRSLLHELNVRMVVIAVPNLPRDRFVRICNEVTAAGVKVSVVPDHVLSADLWTEYGDIDGLLLASFGSPPEHRMYETAKRLFDLVLALVVLVLVAPFWAVTALLIRLDSLGPALFRQERVGENGKIFRMFKFRTMFSDTPPYGFSPTSSEDTRITRLGRFLRRTSFDEFPQLLNVILGDMSLVGPRPEMPFIVRKYKAQHRKRLQVKPGITGLWQLSADRAFHIHENIEYDLYYIRNRSFFMDLAILLHTLFFAMRGI